MGLYNPADYIVSLGDIPITGFASGTFLKISRNTPNAKIKIGAQGDIVITLSRDKSGTATLTLDPTQASNDDLSSLAQLLEAQVIRGDGIVGFQMTDLGGTTVAHGSIAFVSKYPDIQGADDASDREWEVTIADLVEYNVGGTNV